MKLEKAIEILTLSLNTRPSIKDPDFDNASKLGIEAMKHIKKYRTYGILDVQELLPGETPPCDSP